MNDEQSPILLNEKNRHPRDEFISFEEECHIYTVNGERGTYKSVTTFIHEQFRPFPKELAIANILRSKRIQVDPSYKYYQKTREQILEMWAQTSIDGTRFHADIEAFMNGQPVSNDSVEYQYFLDFWEKHKESLFPYRTEWCVWHEDLKFSGSIDMVFENRDGSIQIYDWKRTGDLNKNEKTKKSINPCIGHISDCKYSHYAIQLNLYRRILQEKYGKRVERMCLLRMHPENDPPTYEHIEVPIMEEEIDALFDYRKKQLENPEVYSYQLLLNEAIQQTNEKKIYRQTKSKNEDTTEIENSLHNFFQLIN